MTKLTLLPRAAATAAAALGPCAAVLISPPLASAAGTAHAGGESTPLDLTPTTAGTHSVSSGGASLVRTIVGLAIVIAVIWGLSWILRQVKTSRDPHVSSAGLASVAALALGSGRSVHLVRAGSEYVLLGSAEHGLVPIHRYTEQEAREAGLLLAEEQPARRRASLLAPRGGVADRPAVHEYRVAPQPGTAERPDPMSVPSPGPGTTLIERLREWTVRH
ncbi:MAG: FliO/MopB family protein [Solirubrobacteraceae bacterium]